MATFKVRVLEVHSVEIEVQADTVDGAKLAAKVLGEEVVFGGDT